MVAGAEAEVDTVALEVVEVSHLVVVTVVDTEVAVVEDTRHTRLKMIDCMTLAEQWMHVR